MHGGLAAPDSAGDAATQATDAARRNPAFVTAVVVFVVGFVIGRGGRRKGAT